MPMDFPDMTSLLRCAEAWRFREPNPGETEQQYRNALADFVQPQDLVESMEIRTSKGWDRFSDNENWELLARGAKR